MAFLGMRGNGSWGEDVRPTSFREGILWLFPNGAAPVTAIMSMTSSRVETDSKFTWWTKKLPQQGCPMEDDGVYTNVTLATPYSSGGAVGSIYYVKVLSANATEFRPGHNVILRKVDTEDKTHDYRYNVRAGVIAVESFSATHSYIAIKLDTAPSASFDMGGVNRIDVSGNFNEDGDTTPPAVNYDPEKFSNIMSIMRTSLGVTRRGRKTRYRTGDAMDQLMRDTLQIHSLEMEKEFIDGAYVETKGPNGHELTKTRGLERFIGEFAPENIFDFKYGAAYSGKTWLDDGEEFLDDVFEQLFLEGSSEKLVGCGSGFVKALNRLARQGSDIQLSPTTSTAYGLKIREWITPYGDVALKTFPLLSQKKHLRNMAFIMEPKHFEFVYLDDTDFIEDPNKGGKRQTTTNLGRQTWEEEFYTDAGLAVYFPGLHGIIYNAGVNNVV